jgi:hypothetical protein
MEWAHRCSPWWKGRLSNRDFDGISRRGGDWTMHMSESDLRERSGLVTPAMRLIETEGRCPECDTEFAAVNLVLISRTKAPDLHTAMVSDLLRSVSSALVFTSW